MSVKKIVLAGAIAALLLFAVYYFGQYRTKTADTTPFPSPSGAQAVGADRDAHGCIGSAGYSWCGPKDKCLRIWEETCYSGVAQEVQYILADRYHMVVDEVKITVTRQDGDYAGGGAKFGQTTIGEGGVWLARKAGNIWEVVFDGNGSIDCPQLRQEYGFPDTILKPDFCD